MKKKYTIISDNLAEKLKLASDETGIRQPRLISLAIEMFLSPKNIKELKKKLSEYV